MTEAIDLAAPCGLYCGDCEHLPDKCSGCVALQGKPFWTEQYNVPVCPLYGCAVGHKNLEHCGLCGDFPCLLYNSMRDPSMNDEEAAESMRQKLQDLRRRKEIGTAAWLKER